MPPKFASREFGGGRCCENTYFCRVKPTTMQITIKQKPFGYFKITPNLVFIDGELVGKVHRFHPLTLDVGKGEFNLTLKDNFFKSTRHCSVRDGDTILFDTIDNFPMCLYVLYDLILILLMFLHVNLFLPFGAIIATILLFPAFIYAFALINRNHYFVIDNVERAFAYTDDKLVVISPERKQQLIDFKDIACFSCDTDGVVLILKNGETTHRNGTLSELEELIPSELWIRVNRQTLVMRDSIVRYNDTALCINVNGQDKIIHYYSTKTEEVMKHLKAWNPELYSHEDFNETDVESHNAGLSEDLRRLRDYLEKNPSANAQQVADDLHFSLRTAQRRLAELKKMECCK